MIACQMEPPFSVSTYVNVFRAHIEYNPALGIIERTTKAIGSKPHILRGLKIALLFLVGVIARATTIVAVRTPTEVSIAADSLATLVGADGKVTTNDVCKIYSQGNVFIGVAGLANSSDDVARFSVSEIAFSAMRSEQTLSGKMDAAVKAIQSEVAPEMSKIRSARPADFATISDPEKGFMAIMLIGIEDGVPVGIAQKFQVAVDSKNVQVVPSERLACPGADCPIGFYVFSMGQTEEMMKYMAAPHPTFATPADLARTLVQVEIDARAPSVGPPVDVVRVTTQGTELKTKAGCPIEIRPK
jgi:hypothetical protein